MDISPFGAGEASLPEVALSQRNKLGRPTSEVGQTEKNSLREYAFRFSLKLGHCLTQLALRIWANTGRRRRRKPSLSILADPQRVQLVGKICTGPPRRGERSTHRNNDFPFGMSTFDIG
jgi:hypothetical protein